MPASRPQSRSPVLPNPDSRRPLVIGYGNPLRRDDGVGWRVAHDLASDPRATGIDVIAAHQLTPEYALDVHHASIVVFIDAQVSGLPPPLPGQYAVTRLPPDGHLPAGGHAGGETSPDRAATSHHCTPQHLRALASGLYGSAPPMLLLGVGVDSLDLGEDLTAPVATALPAITETVLRVITQPHSVLHLGDPAATPERPFRRAPE